MRRSLRALVPTLTLTVTLVGVSTDTGMGTGTAIPLPPPPPQRPARRPPPPSHTRPYLDLGGYYPRPCRRPYHRPRTRSLLPHPRSPLPSHQVSYLMTFLWFF